MLSTSGCRSSIIQLSFCICKTLKHAFNERGLLVACIVHTGVSLCIAREVDDW